MPFPKSTMCLFSYFQITSTVTENVNFKALNRECNQIVFS